MTPENNLVGLRLLLVADGRSPITRRWINMLQPLDMRITLVSTYPCDPLEGISSVYILPIAFSKYSGSQVGTKSANSKKGLVAKFRPLAATIRHWLGPWTLSSKTNEYLKIVSETQPDIIQAMRIPFEGMLASASPKEIPLVVSTWGNDLTLHAPSTRKMSSLTRRTLQRANGLIADVRRDAILASDWGFDSSKPTLVVPGNGGLNLDEISSVIKGIVKADPPQIINPRGLRSYVRNDTFFKSIPLVLRERPDVHFVCTSMAAQPEALQWVQKLGIEKNVALLPYLSQHELWQEFARSEISVSVSTHDGTPNTLLEAMAIGCFPICGDIESIREWITDKDNGLLVNPANEKALAKSILFALSDHSLISSGSIKNQALVNEKVEISAVRKMVIEFFCMVR